MNRNLNIFLPYHLTVLNGTLPLTRNWTFSRFQWGIPKSPSRCVKISNSAVCLWFNHRSSWWKSAPWMPNICLAMEVMASCPETFQSFISPMTFDIKCQLARPQTWFIVLSARPVSFYAGVTLPGHEIFPKQNDGQSYPDYLRNFGSSNAFVMYSRVGGNTCQLPANLETTLAN